MSSNRFELKNAAIRFDASGAFFSGGLSRDEQVALAPRLEAARRRLADEIAAEVAEDWSGPGDPAIIARPERILKDYRSRRRKSVLGSILAAAKHFREMVDRVVIVGTESDCASARALFAAGCHPYHNEQGRGDRGGRPRVYFAPSGLDNDAMQGLLDLLPHDHAPATINDRWGLIVIDSGGSKRIGYTEEIGNAENAERQEFVIALHLLLTALRRACEGDDEKTGRLILPLIRGHSPISETIAAIAAAEPFELSSGAGGPAAIFSAAGLLPASILGLDIVRLLEGAAAINERFRTAPIGDNPPLDFAGIGELMRQRNGTLVPRFAGQVAGAAAVAEWCQQVRQGRGTHLKSHISNLKPEIPALQVIIVAESTRRDRIPIEPADLASDPLTHVAGKSLPEVGADAIAAAKAAHIAAGRPTVDFRLPALDEFSLGQLFQAMIIATVLEAKGGYAP